MGPGNVGEGGAVRPSGKAAGPQVARQAGASARSHGDGVARGVAGAAEGCLSVRGGTRVGVAGTTVRREGGLG